MIVKKAQYIFYFNFESIFPKRKHNRNFCKTTFYIRFFNSKIWEIFIIRLLILQLIKNCTFYNFIFICKNPQNLIFIINIIVFFNTALLWFRNISVYVCIVWTLLQIFFFYSKLPHILVECFYFLLAAAILSPIGWLCFLPMLVVVSCQYHARFIAQIDRTDRRNVTFMQPHH